MQRENQQKAVSWMDCSRTRYERKALLVEGKPFFFNGIQIRVDKTADMYGYGEKELKHMFEVAKQDGFTVANAQIRWQDIQPDQKYSVTESTYIRGGEFSSGNYAGQNSMIASYGQKPSDRSLAYFKFDFSGVDGSSFSAAKIRIYVNRTEGSDSVRLYGIEDNSWDADRITWDSGAPNHDGYEVTGEGCYDLGTNPSYDPICDAQYYDLDVTDFINQYCIKNKKASFILQADKSSSNLKEIDGKNSLNAPCLFFSRDDVYDWTQVDNVLRWADEAGIKLEILWFGTDTVNVSIDSRIPYYVFHRYQKSVTEEGIPFIGKEKVPYYGIPSVYWFLMCKNDPELRKKERETVKRMFDHIGEYSSNLHDKKTVIGCQVTNEPAVAHLHMKDMGEHCYCDECRKRKGSLSEQEFRDQTMWEYCNNIACGVKESRYSVWTRVNNLKGTDAEGVTYNEAMRKQNLTKLDFIGFDSYSPDMEEIYNLGHNSYYSQGENLPMIMENSGKFPNTAHLILAALAGGSYYNVYDLCGPDTHGLYDNDRSNIMVPHGSYVEDVRKTNHMLNKVANELATKCADGEGGRRLVFFNEKADIISALEKKIRSIQVNYNTYDQGIGIVIDRGSTEIVAESTTASQFIFRGLAAYGIDSVTVGYYDENEWIAMKNHAYDVTGEDVIILMPAFGCVQIRTRNEIPEKE